MRNHDGLTFTNQDTAPTVQSKSIRVVATLLFVLCTTGVAHTTLAAEANDVPHQRVSYEGLDLTAPAGAAILYKRIQRAAEGVCGEVDIRELGRLAARQTCIDSAIARAVAAVNSPVLTSLHLSKSSVGAKPLVAREH